MTGNIFKYIGLAAVAVLLAASCGPDDPEIVITPEFPSLVENNNVLPGEVLTLSFIPNMDWKVSIPEESIRWFSIIDGSFETDYISGKASETEVHVEIKVADIEEFASSRTCEVSLTMGDQTKIIARYTRQAKERVLSMYTVQFDGEGFMFGGEDGGYLYSEEEAARVDLVWPLGTDGFRLPVKVDANFEWTLALPEWAEADIPENTAGLNAFDIKGVPSKYPLMGDEGKLVFKDGDTVVKEYVISIPACIDRFGYSLSGSMTSLKFNGDGDYAVSIGYEEGPATGTIYGPEGVRIYAVDKTEDGCSASEAEWVHIRIADWDASGDVLQTRTVEYSVDVNEGAEREALVVLLPATFEGTVSDIFEGSQIKEEYAANSFALVQSEYSDEFLSPTSDESDRESVGMFFSKVESGPFLNWFGATDFGYKLIYSLDWSADEGWLYLKEAFDSYKVFNTKREEMSAEELWISVEYTENRRSVRIVMDADEKSESYVAFYDVAGNNLAVVRCIYDPSYAPDGGGEFTGEFIGESAYYAEMVGASLEEITSGPLFDQWIEYNAPIYQLTYKVDNFPMRITLPRGTVYYLPNPYAKRNLFRVNNLDYDESIGSFEFIEGGVDIYMSLDENSSSLVSKGVILFSSEKFNTTDKVTLVLICTLDMSGE